MSDSSTLNPLLAQVKQNEQLLWTGKSNPDAYCANREREVKRFFLGGALFIWSTGLGAWATDGFGSKTILCFVLGCVGFLIGYVSSKERPVPKWWYAVTDHRILTDYPTEEAEMIWQLPLTHIRKMSLKKQTENVGTIQFNFSFLRQNCIPFECIDDAEIVYKIIEDAWRLRKSPPLYDPNDKD